MPDKYVENELMKETLNRTISSQLQRSMATHLRCEVQHIHYLFCNKTSSPLREAGLNVASSVYSSRVSCSHYFSIFHSP